MTDDQIRQLATDAVRAMMTKLRWQEDRTTACGAIFVASFNVLRSTAGDKFVRGLLHGALAVLDTSKPGAGTPACTDFHVQFFDHIKDPPA